MRRLSRWHWLLIGAAAFLAGFAAAFVQFEYQQHQPAQIHVVAPSPSRT